MTSIRPRLLTLGTLGTLSTLSILSILSASAHAAPRRLAVLELHDAGGAVGVGEPVLRALADLVRGAALPPPARPPVPAPWSVLTRENVEALLPPGTALADCLADCEIEVGRRLGAEVVLTGTLTRLGPSRTRVTLRAHATADAALLAQAGADAPSTEQLPEATRAAARALFATLAGPAAAAGPKPTQVTLRGAGGATLQRVEGGRAHPLCRAPCDLAIDPRALHRVAFEGATVGPPAFSLPAGEAFRLTARPRNVAQERAGLAVLALGGLTVSAGALNGALDEGLSAGYTVGGVAGGLGLLVLGAWLVARSQTDLNIEPVSATESAPFPPTAPP